MSFRARPTQPNVLMLHGASLPWRLPSIEAQNKATCQSAAHSKHSIPRPTPDTKTVASEPLNILKTVCDVAHEVVGTVIDTNAPLMSAGLDSLSATGLTSALS